MSTVTAVLSPAASEPVPVTVSAVAAADAESFTLSANRELKIATGQTQSAGTVTITAVDDDVYGPGQQVTATGTVAGQPGLEAPYARTLTITDDDDGGAVPPDLRCRGGGGHQSPPPCPHSADMDDYSGWANPRKLLISLVGRAGIEPATI